MGKGSTRGSLRKLLVVIALAVVIIVGIQYAIKPQEQAAPLQAPIKQVPAEQRSSVPTFAHIHGLAVDPMDPTVIYAATHHGLFKIKDGSKLSFVGTAQYDLMGFNIHPRDPTIMYASGHPPTGGNLGFMKSIDGGKTWQRLALSGQVDFHAIAVSPANPEVIYAFDVMSVRVYKSQDGGGSWKALEGKGLSEVIQLAADPKDPNVVYAAADQGLYVSRDGGSTWSPIDQLRGTTVLSVAVHPTENSMHYALAYKRGLFKSTDGGKSWTQVKMDTVPEGLQHLALDPLDPRILFVASSSQVYRSLDGGARLQALTPHRTD